ncbi:MAG TPA: trypsin-like serine protease [Acidimicrobiales bacterium]|nr:trypsin-like serine protease [Acidimicrobiales bacterium]
MACIAILVGNGTAGAITYGTADGVTHPEVGALVGFFPPAGKSIAYCSGTLISPTVFLTAAHCGFLGPTVGVTFDPTYTSSSIVYTGTFYADPDFKPSGNTEGGTGEDIAVVVLDRPISGLTPAALPTAGLLDQMKANGTLDQDTQFTAVGYGDSQFTNGPGGQTTAHLQARYFAVGSYNSLDASELHLSQNPATGNAGTCNGDSGGPNFLGAGSGETAIIAGITVTGDTYCKSTNVDFRVDTQSARDFLASYVTLP